MKSHVYKIKKTLIKCLLKINKVKHLRILKNSQLFSDEEELEAYSYVMENGIDTYTNKLSMEYKPEGVNVYTDESLGLKYVFWRDKKMYMPKNMCCEEIQDYISFLMSEQDPYSPHSYLDIPIEEGNIVVDIGAAEGNFSLDVVDRVKKIYLFESNPKWNECLKETFKPYKDKVEIINAFIGRNTPIEKFVYETPDLIKIDSEGCELEIIGSSEYINRKKSKVVAAAYHNGEDAKSLMEILEALGYTVHFTKGRMIFLYSFKTSKPILRKGLIIAEPN